MFSIPFDKIIFKNCRIQLIELLTLFPRSRQLSTWMLTFLMVTTVPPKIKCFLIKIESNLFVYQIQTATSYHSLINYVSWMEVFCLCKKTPTYLHLWKIQWIPLNVITVNVISCLWWSDCIGPICWILHNVTI